jgi:gliding motility-associated-like protein
MKKTKFVVVFLLLLSNLIFGQNNHNLFTENKGQIIDQNGKPNHKVKFLLNTNGLNVQLREKGFSYDVYETKRIPLTKKELELNQSLITKNENKENLNYKLEYIYHRLDIDFIETNKNVVIKTEGKSNDYENYYTLKHKPDGVNGVYSYKSITYQNIYNNIDVIFTIPKDKEKPVEYNFVIKPGGKVSDIKMKFSGADTELANKKIKVKLRFGVMEEIIPMSWIENGEKKNKLNFQFIKIKNNLYGFSGELNESTQKIVIDPVPVRLWGTFYGDQTNSHYTLTNPRIDTDSYGNVILVGSTYASNSSYATVGAHQSSIPQSNYPDFNGIIAKFNSNGQRIWGTYYGGTSRNFITGVKIDSFNNVVVCGNTNSTTNISSIGTHQQNFNGYDDVFIAKFNSDGGFLWGTYYGGDNKEYCSDIALDELNNIYIVGQTWSLNNISFNSNFQSNLFLGDQYNVDAYLAKFNPNGNIIWATYAGGEKQDTFNAIKVKGSTIVVGGYSKSSQNISTPNVFQVTKDSNTFYDGILYKFSINGNRIWSSYYGGENEDYILSIELDDEDNIYFGGQTISNNNITTIGSFEYSNSEGYKGFFAKFNPTGNRIWGSYLSDFSVGTIKFQNNSIYLGSIGVVSTYENTHYTNSCSYRQYGFDEGYIGKFNKSGEHLWGSLIGKVHQGLPLAFFNNNIFVSGTSTSVDSGITDQNSYQQNIIGNIGSGNYFLLKLEESNLCISTFQPQSNSPVCTNDNITFQNIPNGYNYHWTGPNNFESFNQYPVINNATNLNSGVYNLTISDNSNCCVKTFQLNVVVGSNIPPIPTLTTLPTITGDCSTVISTIPTATGNCIGLINGTTTDPLSYSLPGNYTITWNYSDGNGNTITQNQNVIITSVDLPQVNSPQSFCVQDSKTINDISISGINIKWYDALTNGNLLQNNNILQNGITYFASQTINGCESLRTPILVNVYTTPAPTGSGLQQICENGNPTLNQLSIAGTNIQWYASLSSNIVLPLTTLLVDGNTYYASQTINGCESVDRLAVAVDLISGLNANNYNESLCDNLNDGRENVDLSSFNSNLISPITNFTFKYFNNINDANNNIVSNQISSNRQLAINNNTFFVRIESQNGCFQVVRLEIDLVAYPVITINDNEGICLNGNKLLNAGSGFDTYTWSTGEITQTIYVSIPGDYTVTVTKNNCSSTKLFKVFYSEIPEIAKIETIDWTDYENSITVYTTRPGDFEYSIDGVNYQDSNKFEGLISDYYRVYVKDKSNCGLDYSDTLLLNYPKFFTPNNDGYNDLWRIKHSQFEPKLTIQLFDRYGKLIKFLNAKDAGWNGKHNGNDLPSTDYWFLVTRQDGRIHKGHFSLKR